MCQFFTEVHLVQHVCICCCHTLPQEMLHAVCSHTLSSSRFGNALQVLMVVFEILSSHLHMARWHEAKIDQHTHDLEALQEAGAKMSERLLALDQVSNI